MVEDAKPALCFVLTINFVIRLISEAKIMIERKARSKADLTALTDDGSHLPLTRPLSAICQVVGRGEKVMILFSFLCSFLLQHAIYLQHSNRVSWVSLSHKALMCGLSSPARTSLLPIIRNYLFQALKANGYRPKHHS